MFLTWYVSDLPSTGSLEGTQRGRSLSLGGNGGFSPVSAVSSIFSGCFGWSDDESTSIRFQSSSWACWFGDAAAALDLPLSREPRSSQTFGSSRRSLDMAAAGAGVGGSITILAFSGRTSSFQADPSSEGSDSSAGDCFAGGWGGGGSLAVQGSLSSSRSTGCLWGVCRPLDAFCEWDSAVACQGLLV